MEEWIEVTKLGQHRKRYLNTRTSEVHICSCLRRVVPGKKGVLYGSEEIFGVREDCIVHRNKFL